MAGLSASLLSSNVTPGKEAPVFLLKDKDDRKAGIAVIGVGSQGGRLAEGFTLQPDVEVKAVCDIRAERVALAQKRVTDAGGVKPDGYSDGPTDYSYLLERDVVDGCYPSSGAIHCQGKHVCRFPGFY